MVGQLLEVLAVVFGRAERLHHRVSIVSGQALHCVCWGWALLSASCNEHGARPGDVPRCDVRPRPSPFSDPCGPSSTHESRLTPSQESLAYKLDMHRAYAGAIERAEQNVTLRTLAQLADRLGVDPEDLICRIP